MEHHFRSHLERIRLPNFSGKPEDWAEFRREFLDLVESDQLPASIHISHLKKSLPREAKLLIDGITDSKEAWSHLNKQYGDKTLAIINTKAILLSHDAGNGTPDQQVDSLLQAVRRAISCLRTVGAEHTLFSDFSLVGQLLAKIPQAVQDRWHFHSTSSEFVSDPEDTGPRFIAWLEREGEAARSARLSRFSMSLSNPKPTQQPSKTQPSNPPRPNPPTLQDLGGEVFLTGGAAPGSQAPLDNAD